MAQKKFRGFGELAAFEVVTIFLNFRELMDGFFKLA
jgi:hypothetical protein